MYLADIKLFEIRLRDNMTYNDSLVNLINQAKISN